MRKSGTAPVSYTHLDVYKRQALTDLPESQRNCTVMGRDLMTGMPKQIIVTQAEIAHCLDKSLSKIEESVMKLLEEMPPELAGDIYQRGMYLSCLLYTSRCV